MYLHQMTPRNRAILNLITSPVALLGIGALMVYGYDIFAMSWQANEMFSTIWAPPLYLVKFMVPCGSLLFLLQILSEMLKDIFAVLARITN